MNRYDLWGIRFDVDIIAEFGLAYQDEREKWVAKIHKLMTARDSGISNYAESICSSSQYSCDQYSMASKRTFSCDEYSVRSVPFHSLSMPTKRKFSCADSVCSIPFHLLFGPGTEVANQLSNKCKVK
jgi:hypothetical protein